MSEDIPTRRVRKEGKYKLTDKVKKTLEEMKMCTKIIVAAEEEAKKAEKAARDATADWIDSLILEKERHISELRDTIEGLKPSPSIIAKYKKLGFKPPASAYPEFSETLESIIQDERRHIEKLKHHLILIRSDERR